MALVVKALKIEIFVLCMIVLIGLAVRSRRSLFSSTQQLLFSMLGYTSAAYILFDMIWTLSDGVDGTLGIAVNWISNAVSFSLFAIACLIWFIYSETVQGSRLLTSRYRVVLVALPTALVVVLAFTSYWTHALFYIDSQGVYRRGFAYMIQPIVSYCYVIHTSLHAFVHLAGSRACRRRPSIEPWHFSPFRPWWAVPFRSYTRCPAFVSA